MKLIIITSPDFIPDEASIVTELFKAGLDLLHVRKPDADVHAVENLLQGMLRNIEPGLSFMISSL